jgi:amino acid transporter
VNVTQGLKRLLIGRKLESSKLGQTLLPKRIALPVFASDALSSVAYAPDEILVTLSLAGAAGYAFSWKIGIAVACVMLVVVMSYRQTVHAYPSGGGDYEVATANLGPNAGLVVASALLVDYLLTVAVSVSSGIQNAEAMIPALNGHEGLAAAGVIVVLTGLNLRGTRESGTFFAIPVYAFMVSVGAMVIWGLVRIFVLGEPLRAPTAGLVVQGEPKYSSLMGLAMVALLARTFSSGCAALTGVEAISNGVPSFREPKSRNAAATLALLGGIAVSMLMGIIVLSRVTGVQMFDSMGGGSRIIGPNGHPLTSQTTVVGQLARTVFFDTFRPGFYIMIICTMVILFLAANTAFNGFPVLGSILAKDGFLPRQLHTRGDRLAYSNGIITLAVGAAVLVLVFNASVTALIQLYVVGVFISFTVSQTGMLRHWTRRLRVDVRAPREQRRSWQRSRVINGIGLVMTGVVLIIILISKFVHGAYLALLAMAAIFALMKAIHRHYHKVHAELELSDASDRALPSRVHAVVMVADLNKPTMRALQFAKATVPTFLEAVTVDVDPDDTEKVLSTWQEEEVDVPIKVIASPYREITNPFIEHIRRIRSENPRDMVEVFIPEYVVGHWWEQLLHNQTGVVIRARLHLMPGVLISTVPYQLSSSRYAERRWRRNDPRSWRDSRRPCGCGGQGWPGRPREE